MANTGGGQLAGEFELMLSDIRKSIDGARDELKSAVGELVGEINNGKAAAMAIRKEAALVRASFGKVLGNNPPVDGETPQDTGERG